MGTFTVHKAIERFETLKSLIIRGKEIGIDTTQLVSKIDSIIEAMNDQAIRIVLLGSFSDGKTSAIAGLLGQLKENMKIDPDESSDDLVIYRFDDIENVVIIDTPGLFGTKEKEKDGQFIKYSDITERYISEANIVLYVCDAVTPIKESHIEILRKVLRDFGKLKATVFVLNKMDEAGIDMLDPNDYNRGSDIKKKALIKRLEETIGLTPEEKDQLHAVCISADPKGKGIEYWLTKKESYKERSHISLLQDSIVEIVDNSDVEELKTDTNLAVVIDVINNTRDQLSGIINPVEEAIQNSQEITNELSIERDQLRRELIATKGRLLEDINEFSSSIRTAIDEADQSTIASLIDNKLGFENGEITFYILDSRIMQIISNCVESNNFSISKSIEEFSQKLNNQEAIIKDALKLGTKKLGNLTVTNTQVINVRNQLGKCFKWAKNIKFKPHGATKLAGKITRGAGWATMLINIGLDLYSYFKEKREMGKFLSFKEHLKSIVTAKTKDLYSISDDKYIEDFAPSYLELCRVLEQRIDELISLQNRLQLIKQYNDSINLWLNNQS